jgi:AAA+ ATPase superfamily predicted ATPase
MIPRTAELTVKRLALGFPVVAITGPRQAGKTTLARAVFAEKPYVSLEDPEEREFATADPRRFLARFAEGAVIDEAQRCPVLLSLSPQFRQTAGENPQTVFSRHRAGRAFARHPRRAHLGDPCPTGRVV